MEKRRSAAKSDGRGKRGSGGGGSEYNTEKAKNKYSAKISYYVSGTHDMKGRSKRSEENNAKASNDGTREQTEIRSKNNNDIKTNKKHKIYVSYHIPGI